MNDAARVHLDNATRLALAMADALASAKQHFGDESADAVEAVLSSARDLCSDVVNLPGTIQEIEDPLPYGLMWRDPPLLDDRMAALREGVCTDEECWRTLVSPTAAVWRVRYLQPQMNPRLKGIPCNLDRCSEHAAHAENWARGCGEYIDTVAITPSTCFHPDCMTNTQGAREATVKIRFSIHSYDFELFRCDEHRVSAEAWTRKYSSAVVVTPVDGRDAGAY